MTLYGLRLVLGALLCLGVGYACRAVRPPPSLGPEQPAGGCTLIEVEGEGVRCARLRDGPCRAGDRLAGERRTGRMLADRQAIFGIPVEVNRASVDELASLDEIGPRLAARIVAGRPYTRVEEVGRVRGVGADRLHRLRSRLVLDE
jgi:hypothetical protein